MFCANVNQIFLKLDCFENHILDIDERSHRYYKSLEIIYLLECYAFYSVFLYKYNMQKCNLDHGITFDI